MPQRPTRISDRREHLGALNAALQIDVGRIDRFAVGSGLLKVTMSIDNLAKCVCIAGENYTVTCHHKP